MEPPLVLAMAYYSLTQGYHASRCVIGSFATIPMSPADDSWVAAITGEKLCLQAYYFPACAGGVERDTSLPRAGETLIVPHQTYSHPTVGIKQDHLTMGMQGQQTPKLPNGGPKSPPSVVCMGRPSCFTRVAPPAVTQPWKKGAAS
eukprot:1117610-Amphidinium_carterae.1